MTVLYLYLVVWGATDWAFSFSGSNCSHTVVLCHFPCFLAQSSPPATWVYHLYAHSSPQLQNVSNLAGFNILQPLNKHFACKVGLAIIISIETIDFKLPILLLLFATAYYYNFAALVTIDFANICRGQIIMPALQPAHFCFEIGTQ